MTKEIAYSVGLTYSKGNVEIDESASVGTVDVTGNNVIVGTLDLTTSFEAIPLGEVATIGICRFENLGSVNVEIREDLTGNSRFVLKPGDPPTIVRLDATGFATPAAKAASGTSRLKFTIIED